MLTRVLMFTAATLALLFLPHVVVAQFGLGNRRQGGGGGGAGGGGGGTSFQELQEMAKRQQEAGAGGIMGGFGAAGAGVSDMAKMIEDALKDPVAKEYLEKMGHNFEQAMEQLSKMTPEEMKKQMNDAMAALMDNSILDSIVASRDEILKQIELTHSVPAEELLKMKTDPDYFESKMKESFGQMQNLFNNPEMAEYMTQALTGMKDMFTAGGQVMTEIEKLVESGDLTNDDTIEEARLALLKGDFDNNPLLSELLDQADMQGILKDATKFRASVKQGQQALGFGGRGAAAAAAAGAGARIGEL